MCGKTANVSQSVLQLYIMHLHQCVCVCVCVSVVVRRGLALNTSTHTKVNGMTHGDLYVRMPSRSSAKTLLNREREREREKKKEQLCSQFGSVHGDISDRKLETRRREKRT